MKESLCEVSYSMLYFIRFKCPGHLLNFWTFRAGAYSKLCVYLNFPLFQQF